MNVKNKKNHENIDIFCISLLLLCLVVASCYSTRGLYAKYKTVASGSDTAIVARWDGTVSGDEETTPGDGSLNESLYAGISAYDSGEYSGFDISSSSPDSNGYVTSYGYKFTVTTTAVRDTAAKVSVKITVTRNNSESWPAGLTAGLYKKDNNGDFVWQQDSTNGEFEIASLAANEAYTGEFVVRFKAAATTVVGTYSLNLTASLEQID